MKQSKPKQRTNWKQRALHCEEVIGVQNELAGVTGEELRQYKIAYKRELDRAELAETRVKSLQSDVEQITNDCKRYSLAAIPAATHWQRFKSWLAEYGYELLGGAFVLAVLAGCVAFVYWPR